MNKRTNPYEYLRKFLVRCDAGSHAKAAPKLGIKEPGLHSAMKNLEEYLDCGPLFIGDELTTHGRNLRDKCRQPMKELDLAFRHLALDIRIGVTQYISKNFLPAIPATSNTKVNSITYLVADASKLNELLISGELDFALGPVDLFDRKNCKVVGVESTIQYKIVATTADRQTTWVNLFEKYDVIAYSEGTATFERTQTIKNELRVQNPDGFRFVAVASTADETTMITLVKHFMARGTHAKYAAILPWGPAVFADVCAASLKFWELPNDIIWPEVKIGVLRKNVEPPVEVEKFAESMAIDLKNKVSGFSN